MVTGHNPEQQTDGSVDEKIVQMHDQEMTAVKWYCLVLDDLLISTPTAGLFKTYLYSVVMFV